MFGQSFSKERDPAIFTSNWDFVEFLITSPEPPIQSILNATPIYYENLSEHESFRNQVYQQIYPNEILFAKQFTNYFRGIVFSKSFAIIWLNEFLRSI